MELVTLAHVTLNRVGSASSHGFVSQRQVSKVAEVRDGNPDTLMELVKNIAAEHGEARERLHAMRREDRLYDTGQKGVIAFDVQGPNTQYSSAYALCRAHPALKIGVKYFELDEVAV